MHLIRSSLDYASWKERKAIAAALRPIYAAGTLEAAQGALEDFANSLWGKKYPTIVQSWRRAWEHVIPFFAFPPEVRRIIYTTDEIDKRRLQPASNTENLIRPDRLLQYPSASSGAGDETPAEAYALAAYLEQESLGQAYTDESGLNALF